MIKDAVKEWRNKWAPAIIQLSETLTGKQGAVYKQSQMASHGRLIVTILVFNVYIINPSGCCVCAVEYYGV